uniref:Butyrophilin subfamily 1 member A1-like n=1 Tax=Sphenodon punctatus TaxID=8508 RepID=A0A8D0H3U4_SPHPU
MVDFSFVPPLNPLPVTMKMTFSCGCSSQVSCFIIIFFIASHVPKLESAPFSVTGPGHPITTIVGADAVLPCHLSPRMNAKNMEVRWLRVRPESPSLVHLYRNERDQNEYQAAEYEGRTQLLRNDITNGSVALRIGDVRPSDEGNYSCLFQSITFFEEALLELKVAGLGSAPLISVEGYEDGGIRMVCQSAGWYPEPEVLWRGLSGQNLPSFTKTKSQGDNGMFDVENVIILRENANRNMSCLIRSSHLNQTKQSAIYISDSFFPRVNPWMVVLNLLFPVSLILFGLMAYLFRVKRKHCQKIGKLTVELGELSEKYGELETENRKHVAELGWRRFVVPVEEANVTLDPDTANPWLIVAEDRKSVLLGETRQDLPDNPQRFSYELCVLGCEGFTSGRHYWEYEVGGVGYWAVGAARESVRRNGGISLSPKEGIWAVWHCGGQYKALTSPVTPLSLSPRPRRIRMSLDFVEDQVVFFDAGNEAPIFTFLSASLSGERICPWLRLGDTGSPLRLYP